MFKAVEHARPIYDAATATGVPAPVPVLIVWVAMRRPRNLLAAELKD